MAFLLTGGAGVIGSHTEVELLEAGYEIAPPRRHRNLLLLCRHQ